MTASPDFTNQMQRWDRICEELDVLLNAEAVVQQYEATASGIPGWRVALRALEVSVYVRHERWQMCIRWSDPVIPDGRLVLRRFERCSTGPHMLEKYASEEWPGPVTARPKLLLHLRRCLRAAGEHLAQAHQGGS